jgi:hypothetical protein
VQFNPKKAITTANICPSNCPSFLFFPLHIDVILHYLPKRDCGSKKNRKNWQAARSSPKIDLAVKLWLYNLAAIFREYFRNSSPQNQPKA